MSERESVREKRKEAFVKKEVIPRCTGCVNQTWTILIILGKMMLGVFNL